MEILNTAKNADISHYNDLGGHTPFHTIYFLVMYQEHACLIDRQSQLWI